MFQWLKWELIDNKQQTKGQYPFVADGVPTQGNTFEVKEEEGVSQFLAYFLLTCLKFLPNGVKVRQIFIYFLFQLCFFYWLYFDFSICSSQFHQRSGFFSMCQPLFSSVMSLSVVQVTAVLVYIDVSTFGDISLFVRSPLLFSSTPCYWKLFWRCWGARYGGMCLDRTLRPVMEGVRRGWRWRHVRTEYCAGEGSLLDSLSLEVSLCGIKQEGERAEELGESAWMLPHLLLWHLLYICVCWYVCYHLHHPLIRCMALLAAAVDSRSAPLSLSLYLSLSLRSTIFVVSHDARDDDENPDQSKIGEEM